MANGPPSSAAESSGNSDTAQREPLGVNPSVIQVSQRNSPGSSIHTYGSYWPGYPTTTPYPVASLSGPSTTPAPYYNPYFNQGYYPTQVLQTPPASTPNRLQEAKTAPKSPSPPPFELYRHWDEALKTFLRDAGLLEALRGFETDMLVMSADWEQESIPTALRALVKRLTGVSEYVEGPGNMMEDDEAQISLDERKLTYMTLANGAIPRTPSSINKSISQLLAKNRAKNNASNRSEFSYSMAERRRQVQERSLATVDPSALGSCARTDAKPINRDEQMKYDIARNNDGPLSRTVKSEPIELAAIPSASEKSPLSVEELLRRQQDEENALASRYPALDDRLKNIETHFAIRYVPSPPRTLISRLRLLEDHIMKLEKEYPPWAALHFNQPNRGWPPPPRATPIIVPPNLRSKDDEHFPLTKDTPKLTEDAQSSSKTKQRNPKSSLHRAVMKRLQVQQAMNDLGNSDS